MTFDDMKAAVDQAEHTMRLVDAMADKMARLLVGRLRHVSPSTLRSLKRELRDFNIHLGRWNS